MSDPTVQTTTSAQLRSLFEACADLSSDERARFLRENNVSAEVEVLLQSMLQADSRRGDVFDTPAADWAEHLQPVGGEVEAMVGTTVGGFRLVAILGEGGSSVVFRAERVVSGATQTVALKLMRSGLFSSEAQRRFQREQAILTQLSHPNIAHLIDAGISAAGIPFIAMEFVQGESLTDYARNRDLNQQARLRLLAELGRAVDAAHRALIVHRDLKPSNVLVDTDGAIKVVDFGIAKLLDGGSEVETSTLHIALTPGYAAPEQYNSGPVTTAADVYSLGVVASELLLGARLCVDAALPRDEGVGVELRQRWRSLDPELTDLLRCALAADPAHRYSSARHFADDIERYLRAEPITAHPPSRWYRGRKFISRHRVAVALSAVVAAALFAALGAALWQAELARHEAIRANNVRDFLVGLFDSAQARLPRDQKPTPEFLVEQARSDLGKQSDLDAYTRVALMRTLGEVELSLAKFASAQSTFGEARDLAQTIGDASAVQGLQVLLGQSLQRGGRNAEAITLVEALLPALRGSPSADSVRALSVLAAAELAIGHPDQAIAHRREATELTQRVYGNDRIAAIASRMDLGNTLAQALHFPQAIEVLDPALADWHTANGPEDARYVAALDNLATARDALGDDVGSAARWRDLLALQRRIFRAPHDAIAKTLRDLGVVESRDGDYVRAAAHLAEALQMQRAVFGENHEEIAATYNARGVLHIHQLQFAEADADYHAAIAVCDRAAVRSDACASARNNLGQSQYRQGHYDDAKREMNAALAERRALYGNEHPSVAYSLSTLSNVATAQNDYAGAIALAGEAMSILQRLGGASSREAILARNSYAQALHLAGRNAEALQEIERCLADWQRVAPETRARRVIMLTLKAQIEQSLGLSEHARATGESAVALGVAASELSLKTRTALGELTGRDVYPESRPDSAAAIAH